MNKEEILLRSRNDNRKGDELQKNQEKNATFLGYEITNIILGVIYVFGLMKGKVNFLSYTVDIQDFIGTLVVLSLIIELGYRWYFSRKMWQLIFALIMGIAIIINVVMVFN